MIPGKTCYGPAEPGAAIDGDFSRQRERFEQAKALALTGKEEQEYLEQHPILARVPAHQRLYIIRRQWRGGGNGVQLLVTAQRGAASACVLMPLCRMSIVLPSPMSLEARHTLCIRTDMRHTQHALGTRWEKHR